MQRHTAAGNASVEGAADTTSFEALYERERGRLFRALILVTGNTAEAEELTQEAFVRVLERWDRVGRMDDPLGYIFRTAMNLHRSRLRRTVIAARRMGRPTVAPDPLDEIATRDEALRALGMLPPSQRAAVVVTDLYGYPSEEAGRILGIRAGTVRGLVAKARATLIAEKGSRDG
jgi:RNA polymerase sigma-70 factor (ECF subfamily)